MTETAPKNGHIIRYAYLWRGEFERGEESGRKTRPVCVTVILPNAPGATRILLFPVTSQPPRSGRLSLAIPETEPRRTGLRGPARVVLDDCNTDLWQTSFHIEDRSPVGRFSYAFFASIRDAVLGQLQAGLLHPAPRR